MKWLENMTRHIRTLLGESKREQLAKPNEHRKVITEIEEVTKLLRQHNDIAKTITGSLHGRSDSTR